MLTVLVADVRVRLTHGEVVEHSWRRLASNLDVIVGIITDVMGHVLAGKGSAGGEEVRVHCCAAPMRTQASVCVLLGDASAALATGDDEPGFIDFCFFDEPSFCLALRLSPEATRAASSLSPESLLSRS